MTSEEYKILDARLIALDLMMRNLLVMQAAGRADPIQFARDMKEANLTSLKYIRRTPGEYQDEVWKVALFQLGHMFDNVITRLEGMHPKGPVN